MFNISYAGSSPADSTNLDLMKDPVEDVKRGAEYLDNLLGSPRWRELIDPQELDISCPGRCIMGQIERRDADFRAKIAVVCKQTNIYNAAGYAFVNNQALEAWKRILVASSNGQERRLISD